MAQREKCLLAEVEDKAYSSILYSHQGKTRGASDEAISRYSIQPHRFSPLMSIYNAPVLLSTRICAPA